MKGIIESPTLITIKNGGHAADWLSGSDSSRREDPEDIHLYQGKDTFGVTQLCFLVKKRHFLFFSKNHLNFIFLLIFISNFGSKTVSVYEPSV